MRDEDRTKERSIGEIPKSRKRLDEPHEATAWPESSHPDAGQAGENRMILQMLGRIGTRPAWLRYIAVILLVAVAAGVRMILLGAIETRVPYVTFYPAIIIASLYAGLSGGLFATVVSALLITSVWIEPRGGAFIFSDPVDLLGMAAFLVSCSLICFLCEVARRAHVRATEAEAQAKLACEREKIAAEREITVEFLKLVNRSTRTRDLVEAAATFFQRQSGCEAVGIRLKDGEDYPYFEARGFPEEFVLLENRLCAVDAEGNILRDSEGNPYIECMCGNVICGRIDSSKSFFTPGGSFWANGTTRLLASTSDADRQTRTRNRCNGEGYESVALIPLQAGPGKLGLLQLNDRRMGMFTPEIISSWERLAGYLAAALAKFRAEESMRESEEFNRRIIESSSDCIKVLDIEGNLLSMSSSGRRLLDIDDISPYLNTSWIKLWKEDDRPMVAGALKAALREGLGQFQAFCPSTGGKPMWWDVAITPIRAAQGGTERLLAVSRDITARRQAEEALRESRKRADLFATLLENAAEPFSYGGVEGNLLLCNHAFEKLTGYTAEELSSLTWSVDLTPPEYREPQAEILAALIRTGEPVRYEKEYIRKDGSRVPIELFTHVIYADSGEATHFYSFFTDLTARKRMEEELRRSRDELELRVQERTDELHRMNEELQRSNQALEDFASIASHDMREPLRKIIAFGDRLKTRYGESLDITGGDYLDRMQKAAMRMRTLLNALLDYSRISTTAEPLKLLDLNVIVREAMDDLEVRISRSGGEVQVGALASMEGDPHQMRQLFQNLIGNALKFHGKERPVVRVHGEPTEDGRAYRIFIEDNGIGFDEEHLDRIFAPFHRLHGRSSEFEGTGMGLAICQKIVERHGGSITAGSKPGVGSVFILTLPAVV